jgi:cell wall-associated NlpC family hydrolase
VAQTQYDDTAKLGPRAPLIPGDLVFFGSGAAGIDHVGLFVGLLDGKTVMVDAPHTGADVRAEYFPSTPGASFGSMIYVGATRP